MAKTAVALYDSKNEAQLVKDELTNAGFSRSSVRMMDSSDSDAVDTLTNAGLPRNDADAYFEGLCRGGHLVMITTDDDQIDLVVDIMDRYNSVNIQERSETWQSEGWSAQGSDQQTTLRQTSGQQSTERQSATSGSQGRSGAIHSDQDQIAIPVVEEELQVGKRQVQKGGIRVHTHVEEKPVEETVTVREEHINVQRRPVNRAVQPGELDNVDEGTFEISEMDEEVVVNKQARVVEEVVVGKEVNERQERVRDTVRRTDVDVEQIDDRTTSSDSTAGIDSSYTTGFHNHYNSNFASSGMRYEEYEPAYQYGYTMRNSNKMKGQKWADVESQARIDWERNHKGTWQSFKDAVRHGWESMKR